MNFIKKHKKLVIILGVILTLFVLLIIFMFTVFSLKSVEVDYLTTNDAIISLEEDIKNEISLGGTVLFKSKDEISKNIEKKYPYVKVVNIETVFPNKFVLHLAERQELFAVKTNSKFAILDEELKILDVRENFENGKDNPILLSVFESNLDIENRVGEFLDFKETNFGNVDGISVQNFLNGLNAAFQKSSWTINDIQSFSKSLKLYSNFDYKTANVVLCASFLTFEDFEIKFYEPNKDFSQKLSNAIYVYSHICANEPAKLETHRLICYENKQGELTCVLEEKWFTWLKKSYIIGLYG